VHDLLVARAVDVLRCVVHVEDGTEGRDDRALDRFHRFGEEDRQRRHGQRGVEELALPDQHGTAGPRPLEVGQPHLQLVGAFWPSAVVEVEVGPVGHQGRVHRAVGKVTPAAQQLVARRCSTSEQEHQRDYRSQPAGHQSGSAGREGDAAAGGRLEDRIAHACQRWDEVSGEAEGLEARPELILDEGSCHGVGEKGCRRRGEDEVGQGGHEAEGEQDGRQRRSVARRLRAAADAVLAPPEKPEQHGGEHGCRTIAAEQQEPGDDDGGKPDADEGECLGRDALVARCQVPVHRLPLQSTPAPSVTISGPRAAEAAAAALPAS